MAIGIELLFVGESIRKVDLFAFEVSLHRCRADCVVILFPEVDEDVGEVDVLFLHLLMVTPALLCLSSSNEYLHRLEYLVSSSHVTVHEVLVVNLQKPMITLVFFRQPVSMVELFWLFLSHLSALDGLLGWRYSFADPT